MIKNTGLHVKYPLLLSYFKETRIFSPDFRNVLKYNISWKSVQWESNCTMRTDGQTDIKKLTVTFRTSAHAPNKNDILSENSFECLFYVHNLIITLCDPLFCFRRNIPVTNRKDLSPPYTKYVQNKRKRPCGRFGREQYNLLTYSMEQSPSWEANWFCS
jgi:hypothetical protein